MGTLLASTHQKLASYLHDYSVVSKDSAHSLPMISIKDKKIINYDKVSDWHMHHLKYGQKYRSNDALFLSDNECVFVEFKNGSIFKNGFLSPDILKELREKNCSSILVALDLNIVPSWQFIKNQVKYLLVYSSAHTASDLGESVLKIKTRNRNNGGIISNCPQQLFTMKWLFSSLSMCSDKEFVANFIDKHYI